jgi:alanine dehydrogenase
MDKILKIGVLRETKNPPDRRVAITPQTGSELIKKFKNIEIFVQPSDLRCFKDDEYINSGLIIKEDLSDCDILIGVKEVNLDTIIADKKYLFFAHVAKQQPYNRKLFKELISKQVTLLDYEYITKPNGQRVVAFGKWAGIVGAYNALIAYGIKYNLFELKRAKDCFDFKEMLVELKKVKLQPIKILITGKGRVGKGALETLSPLKFKEVTAAEFLNNSFNEPVICNIDADEYTKRKDGLIFDFQHFFKNPEMYQSNFKKFTQVADLYIAAHFWDSKSPIFIGKEDFKDDLFNIKVIADISCDIAEPIASTIRPSTIAEPFYDFNPLNEIEEAPFSKVTNITVMAIDNLPGELPRDSSEYFSKELIDNAFEALLGNDKEGIIVRATILNKGQITERYSYLESYSK